MALEFNMKADYGGARLFGQAAKWQGQTSSLVDVDGMDGVISDSRRR